MTTLGLNLDVPPHTDSHYYVIAHSYWVGVLEDEFKTSMALDRIETIAKVVDTGSKPMQIHSCLGDHPN